MTSIENANRGVPKHKKGKALNVNASETFSSLTAAQRHFALVRERLLHVNHWARYCQPTISGFQLYDGKVSVDRIAQLGDLIRIDIPGPGSTSGNGYDWVQIEAIDGTDNSNEQVFFIRVRPTHPPNGGEEIAHFFNAEATSTFLVTRKGLKVFASVHGRNEQVNLKAKGIWDKFRQFIIGVMAKLGFSYPQWQALVNGLVKRKI